MFMQMHVGQVACGHRYTQQMKLATGGAKPKKHNSGVNLDAAKGMTQLDWHLQESNQKPGPGKYGGSIHMCMHNTHTHTHNLNCENYLWHVELFL